MKFNAIVDILQEKFIFSEQPARLLTLALESKKNCILFGDAGHGKSEMVQTAIDCLELSNDCFVQSFGEGMDEARLWGGLDFRALEEEKVFRFAPHQSFLNYRIAVFEELFDAPAIVLQSLKDTLTARELRNGEQRFKMKTQTIIALTNRHPSEISELGAAAHALVERFPLQHEVKWESYTGANFRALFKKVKPDIPSEIRENLADMIGEVHENGGFISPRSAIHAIEVVAAGAPGFEVNYDALAFIPGFEEVLEGLQSKIEAMHARREAEAWIVEIKESSETLIAKVERENSPIKLLQLTKKLNEQDGLLEELSVPDNMVQERDTLRKTIQGAAKAAQHKALEVTRE